MPKLYVFIVFLIAGVTNTDLSAQGIFKNFNYRFGPQYVLPIGGNGEFMSDKFTYKFEPDIGGVVLLRYNFPVKMNRTSIFAETGLSVNRHTLIIDGYTYGCDAVNGQLGEHPTQITERYNKFHIPITAGVIYRIIEKGFVELAMSMEYEAFDVDEQIICTCNRQVKEKYDRVLMNSPELNFSASVNVGYAVSRFKSRDVYLFSGFRYFFGNNEYNLKRFNKNLMVWSLGVML
jgi:hypothetical protein